MIPLGSLADVFRYRALVRNLVLKDLRLKYRSSMLGVAWSLLNPLLLLAVYTFAFRTVMRMEMENYPYFLLTGLLPWGFFSGALQASTQAITGNGNLLRKVYFPPQVLPVASVLFIFAQFLLAFSAFVPLLLLVSRARVNWTIVFVVPLFLLHVVFIIGIALFLSAATVFFRDVQHLTEVVLLPLFWMTPVVYPVGMIPEALRPVFHFNPIATFIVAYQDVLFWDRVPSAEAIAVMVGGTMVTVVIGHVFFHRWSRSFAEEV